MQSPSDVGCPLYDASSNGKGSAWCCSEWDEDKRQAWLLSELTSKRPLMPPGLQTTAEIADVINTFRTLAKLPPDSLAAYVISMAHTASDVLAVVLLQVTLPPACSTVHCQARTVTARLDDLSGYLLHNMSLVRRAWLLVGCAIEWLRCRGSAG